MDFNFRGVSHDGSILIFQTLYVFGLLLSRLGTYYTERSFIRSYNTSGCFITLGGTGTRTYLITFLISVCVWFIVWFLTVLAL